MARCTRRPQAENDLVDIWTYIAIDNPHAADRLLDSIDNKCRTLAVYPYMGRERQDIESGIYSFPIGNYVVFYEHAEDGIEIVRVLHAARDIHSVF